MAKHICYQTGDIDAPAQVQDSNGEVVLALCRVCGQAEGEMTSSLCPGPRPEAPAAVPELSRERIRSAAGWLRFYNKNNEADELVLVEAELARKDEKIALLELNRDGWIAELAAERKAREDAEYVVQVFGEERDALAAQVEALRGTLHELSDRLYHDPQVIERAGEYRSLIRAALSTSETKGADHGR